MNMKEKANICVISFSGRSGGNCWKIAELVGEQFNVRVKLFDFSALNITPCGKCGYDCFISAESCPYLNDSVYGIYEAVSESDLTFFIVPNYCDYPCSLFFAFNERSQCYFQKKYSRLGKYLSVRKKFIVVSNTDRDNFVSAFRYQVEENIDPEILFLSSRRFGKVSIEGNLTDSEEARELIKRYAKMPPKEEIFFEPLSDSNIDEARRIQREDISTDFADEADTIMELTKYGAEHNCIGDTYAVKLGNKYIGLILLGEAIAWETDPPEMKETPFYRLMGFVMDKGYRDMGLGGYVLEKAIETCYKKYGARPIALGCHKDNKGAERFYLRHGFEKTEYMEENDYYYLRYPDKKPKGEIYEV